MKVISSLLKPIAKKGKKKGRLEVHPDSIAKLKQEVHQKLSMRNVLGMIPGKKYKRVCNRRRSF